VTPVDLKRGGRAAGLTLVAVAIRHAGRHAARRGFRAEPRVAVAIALVDGVATAAFEARRRRKKRLQRRDGVSASSELVEEAPKY
jgi:hypothetical protein